MPWLPFREGEGEFVATAEVKGATLKYFEGFPLLTEAVGSVEFRNASTRARLREGRVGGLKVGTTSFEIEDYRAPVLELEATAAGDVGQALELLQKSPLGPQLGEQFMALSAQGPADFAFDMKLPTGNVAAREYSVRTRMRSATARWPVLREPVTRITGELEIRERSARGEGLRGMYLDGPFEVSVRPGATRPGGSAAILFEGEGRAAGARLPAVIGLPATIRMSGSVPWKLQGRLEQPARGAPWTTHVEVESDLDGLGVDAPRPFAKQPGDLRATRVALDVPRPGRTDLRIATGSARALLEFTRGNDERWRLERGAARFDGRAPARPSRPGLHVGGDWPEFDLAEWLALRSDAPGDTRLGDWLGPVDVHLDRARVIGFEFLDVTAGLRPAGGGWNIEVSGPMAEGRVSIPADLAGGDPIDLQMQRLWLETSKDRGESGGRGETDPRELPAIALRAEDFAWQGRRFGRLEADLARDPRGLRLVSLATRSDAFALKASGSWFAEEQGSRTRLALEFESEDLAAASRALGYRDAVEAERARLTADVAWSGGPDAEALARMAGTVRVELGRGQLRGVKPGAGRILGLTSIVELPRRLALDFRDVTDEGLAFDTVSADFELRAGSAYTENLLLEGPAVDIGVVGRTGLVAQDYDQTVIVSGNPSGPITIAGALAGGPVGAAGALLFSQLFKGQLQGLARAYYRVTGSWSQPVVERISASVGASPPAATLPASPPEDPEP
ncbi:MAG: AsmA-like C-terminal region-containing protein [Vicinamibacterales bacterium]